MRYDKALRNSVEHAAQNEIDTVVFYYPGPAGGRVFDWCTVEVWNDSVLFHADRVPLQAIARTRVTWSRDDQTTIQTHFNS